MLSKFMRNGPQNCQCGPNAEISWKPFDPQFYDLHGKMCARCFRGTSRFRSSFECWPQYYQGVPNAEFSPVYILCKKEIPAIMVPWSFKKTFKPDPTPSTTSSWILSTFPLYRTFRKGTDQRGSWAWFLESSFEVPISKPKFTNQFPVTPHTRFAPLLAVFQTCSLLPSKLYLQKRVKKDKTYFHFANRVPQHDLGQQIESGIVGDKRSVNVATLRGGKECWSGCRTARCQPKGNC